MQKSGTGGQPLPARVEADGSATSQTALRSLADVLPSDLQKLKYHWNGPTELVLYGIVSLATALVIAVFHALMTRRFPEMIDDRQLPLALILYILVGPALWGLWIWQPSAIADILRSLHAVAGNPQARQLPSAAFVAQAQPVPLPAMLSRQPLSILALLVAVALTGVFVSVTSILGQDTGRPLVFGINPFQYLLPWVVVSFLNLWILTTVLIRHSIVIVSIRRAISAFGMAPTPFHPDGCNGLGPIGRYAVQSSWFALVYGMWIAVMLTGSAFDQNGTLSWQVVLWPFGHLLLLSILIVAPVWGAHLAMAEAKHQRLEAIARQLQTFLELKTRASREPERMEVITKLQQRYQVVHEAYREWPLRVPAIRGLSITGAIPLVSLLANLIKGPGTPLLPH